MVTIQITDETMMQLSNITSFYISENSVDENSLNPISETISFLVNETFINIFLKKDSELIADKFQAHISLPKLHKQEIVFEIEKIDYENGTIKLKDDQHLLLGKNDKLIVKI